MTHGDLARMTPRAAQRRRRPSPRSSRRPSRDPRPARAGRSRGRAPDRAARTGRSSCARFSCAAGSRRERRRRPDSASATARTRTARMQARGAQVRFDLGSSARSRLRRSEPRATSTGVFSGRCSSDFFFRIAPSTSPRTCERRIERRARRRPRRRRGERLRRPSATARGEPSRPPPRPHFLGHERQVRREQPQQHRQRRQQRAFADAAPRRRDRRSGAPSPARGSCRRSDQKNVSVRSSDARVVVVLEVARVDSSTSSRRLVSSPRSTGCGHGADRLGPRQHELRRVQQLDRQPPADLHLPGVERGVGARAGRSPPSSARRRSRAPRAGPSASRRCPSTSTSSCDRDRAPSRRSRRCFHGSDAVLELRAQHRREQPGADDVVRLRPHVHREHAREQIGILFPAAGDLRRERRGRPGVHDVGIAGEPARLVALVRRCSRRARRSTDRSAAAPRSGSSRAS